MSRLQKILLGLFTVLLGILVYAEATKPQPVNWFPSYHKIDKIPFGTYILHDLLVDNFGENLEEVSVPPFEKLQDSTLSGTYIFINNYINFDKTELNLLFDWVDRGNTVFIAAHELPNELEDTLKLESRSAVLLNSIETKPLLNLLNSTLKASNPYLLDRDVNLRYFEKIDTLNQTVLGITQVYEGTLKINDPLINYIKAPMGDGFFFIHNQPEVFTNYFILENQNAEYTQNALAYINEPNKVYLDNYYKSGKRINISPLHVLLNNKFLKSGYYILLIGVLLFVLFEGKRKQRSIPIIPRLTNKTYEYTRTISGMYIDKKENHEIAKKQIILFLEFVRTRLRVPTDQINSRFFTAVAARSGNTLEDTKNLFTFMEKVQHQANTSEEELIKLYTDITIFKDKIDGKS